MSTKIISTELPEWAWLSGGDHEEGGDPIKNRNLIFHVRSASVIEIFPEMEFIANEGVLAYNFKHHSEIAGDEYNVAVMHYCAVPEVDDETKMDILKRASEWYKKYCVWEDSNIRMEEIAKYN